MNHIADSTSAHLSQCPAAEQWMRIGIRHHHGINIPLFSLHTESSTGIGEYADLHPLIDWCAKIGMDVIQLLPLNDTGLDSSPYSAISAFALNPIHLGLAHLPGAKQYPDLLQLIEQLQPLSHTPRVQYVQVRELKERFLQQYYAWEYPSIASSQDYHQFIAKNQWLRAYSLFKTIKKQRLWQSWEDWPEDLKKPTPATIESLTNRFLFEVQYHQFVQFLCHQQLKAVKEHAEKTGVFLKGDIPILISRESSDLWENRQLFNLDYSAGAPPDYYGPEGQKWGFPIFNWNALEQENYHWWRQRLDCAHDYYHLYRLDHIVGFFRIWAIPIEKPAKEGLFIPAEEKTWVDHGKKILSQITQSSPLLPIGEDLGTIPNGVRPCLHSLGICGTKVMRWERRWGTTNEFISVTDYLPESMTTVSTHDSPTLAGWWKDLPDEARSYAKDKKWNYLPDLSHEQRRAILQESHHSSSLFHINLLQEYLALFPDLVAADSEQERVNIPGLISDQNWTYRFRPSVEEIISHEALAQAMSGLLL